VNSGGPITSPIQLYPSHTHTHTLSLSLSLDYPLLSFCSPSSLLSICGRRFMSTRKNQKNCLFGFCIIIMVMVKTVRPDSHRSFVRLCPRLTRRLPAVAPEDSRFRVLSLPSQLELLAPCPQGPDAGNPQAFLAARAGIRQNRRRISSYSALKRIIIQAHVRGKHDSSSKRRGQKGNSSWLPTSPPLLSIQVLRRLRATW
jgi:hypothetical protein